jgi:polysaccharide biosynthesis protein PslL
MRNSTIDIAKGIGILTVVLCHNWILYHNRDELSRVVFSFHMPLFFFISGLFFKPNQSLSDLVSSKASGLLKPFYVVLFGVFITVLIFNPQIANNQTNILHELLGIVYGSGSTISWTPLWFLSHLFIVFIFAWVLNKYLLRKLKNGLLKSIFLMLLLFCGVQILNFLRDKPIDLFGFNNLIFAKDNLLRGLPFNLDITLVTTTFFLAGYLMAKKMLDYKFNTLLTAIAFIIFAVLHYNFNETIELNGREYGNFIICTLQIISGIYLVFALSFVCSQVHWLNKTLAYLGEASLFILIFHFMPQHLITGILQYHFPQYNWPIAAFAFFASIIFSLILWEITKKSRFLQMLMLPTKRPQN